ncbi:MAG: TatD family hydrolase [Planctomycetes bacterium]|nr:TatD family hydrolase [Planctomycetota bacterium]
MLPPLIDTHCHLTNGRFDADRAEVIARARAAGIDRLLTIGTGIADGRAAKALADADPGLISASVGLDPFSCHEAGETFPAALAELGELLGAGGFRAVGEIGLEYHHPLNPHPVQIEQLEAQLDLARTLGLPAIIHVRDAHEDMLATLNRCAGVRGVIHSFIGDAATARRYLDLGWHLSFNGTATFKANGFLREAAAMVPADRILIETDSPYLAPLPLRGRRCEPAFVVHTLDLLAEVRGQRREDLAAWTTQNAVKLFGLPPLW